MTLLYKPKEEQTVTVEAKTQINDSVIVLEFSSDCGKFGTEEALAGYSLSAERLLQILREREDITDEELT